MSVILHICVPMQFSLYLSFFLQGTQQPTPTHKAATAVTYLKITPKEATIRKAAIHILKVVTHILKAAIRILILKAAIHILKVVTHILKAAIPVIHILKAAIPVLHILPIQIVNLQHPQPLRAPGFVML